MNDLANITLAKGNHPGEGTCDNPERCFWEQYNWLTRQKHTDSCPPGVSPVLHAFGMRLNDRLPDAKRQELKRFLPNGTDRLAGTAHDGKDETRAMIAANWALHTGARAWLTAAGMDDETAAIDAIAPATDRAALIAARPAIRDLSDRLWDKRAAAYAGLRAKVRAKLAETGSAAAAAAAAADAVADAAAVADAVADAAAAAVAVAAEVADAAAAAAANWSATYSKTYKAVYDAAKKAVEDKYGHTIAGIQDSAIALYDVLITGEWPAAA
jgi:hypothetical protein